MDDASTSGGANRQKRVLPSRARRGGPGVGNCDVDNMIFEHMRRKPENEPLIPANSRFLLSTNSRLAHDPDANPDSPAAATLNTVANDRYFNRPEVIKACRELSLIQTPEFETIDAELSVNRLRARPGEEEVTETSDAAYERRHKKFEAFEKRHRLREKEKLKHEQYKIRERIEQLRAMDSAAFLTLPASHFSPMPNDTSIELEEIAAASSPYTTFNGLITHAEGERRRKEMLEVASMLEHRNRELIGLDRVRKAQENTPAEQPSKAPTPARTEESDGEKASQTGNLKFKLPPTRSSSSVTPAPSPAPIKPATAPYKPPLLPKPVVAAPTVHKVLLPKKPRATPIPIPGYGVMKPMGGMPPGPSTFPVQPSNISPETYHFVPLSTPDAILSDHQPSSSASPYLPPIPVDTSASRFATSSPIPELPLIQHDRPVISYREEVPAPPKENFADLPPHSPGHRIVMIQYNHTPDENNPRYEQHPAPYQMLPHHPDQISETPHSPADTQPDEPPTLPEPPTFAPVYQAFLPQSFQVRHFKTGTDDVEEEINAIRNGEGNPQLPESEPEAQLPPSIEMEELTNQLQETGVEDQGGLASHQEPTSHVDVVEEDRRSVEPGPTIEQHPAGQELTNDHPHEGQEEAQLGGVNSERSHLEFGTPAAQELLELISVTSRPRKRQRHSKSAIARTPSIAPSETASIAKRKAIKGPYTEFINSAGETERTTCAIMIASLRASQTRSSKGHRNTTAFGVPVPKLVDREMDYDFQEDDFIGPVSPPESDHENLHPDSAGTDKRIMELQLAVQASPLRPSSPRGAEPVQPVEPVEPNGDVAPIATLPMDEDETAEVDQLDPTPPPTPSVPKRKRGRQKSIVAAAETEGGPVASTSAIGEQVNGGKISVANAHGSKPKRVRSRKSIQAPPPPTVGGPANAEQFPTGGMGMDLDQSGRTRKRKPGRPPKNHIEATGETTSAPPKKKRGRKPAVPAEPAIEVHDEAQAEDPGPEEEEEL